MQESQIEPALAASVVAAMADGVVVLDLQGRIAGMNRAAAALCGTPAAEALGRPWADVLRLHGETDNTALAQLVEELRYDADAVGTRGLVREDDTRVLGPQGAVPVDLHILHGRSGTPHPDHIILLLRRAAPRGAAARPGAAS